MHNRFPMIMTYGKSFATQCVSCSVSFIYKIIHTCTSYFSSLFPIFNSSDWQNMVTWNHWALILSATNSAPDHIVWYSVQAFIIKVIIFRIWLVSYRFRASDSIISHSKVLWVVNFRLHRKHIFLNLYTMVISTLVIYIAISKININTFTNILLTEASLQWEFIVMKVFNIINMNDR